MKENEEGLRKSGELSDHSTSLKFWGRREGRKKCWVNMFKTTVSLGKSHKAYGKSSDQRQRRQLSEKSFVSQKGTCIGISAVFSCFLQSLWEAWLQHECSGIFQSTSGAIGPCDDPCSQRSERNILMATTYRNWRTQRQFHWGHRDKKRHSASDNSF